jgi:hypothetical protein
LGIDDYSEFFSKALEGVPNDISEEDITDLVGRLMEPLSGADLAGLVTDTKRAAARRSIVDGTEPSLSVADIEEALSSNASLLRGLGSGGGTGYA